MNTIKVSVLLIVVLVVVAGCHYTSKPRTVDSEQARLYPRVPYEAIKDNKDSLDFILSLEAFYEEFGKDKKPYQLSVDEMKMAKKILEKYVNYGESVSAYLQRVYSLPHDGGKHFGRVLVDLTEKKVIRFSLNAVA